jgi:uncharacterized protein YkwD
MYMRDFLHHLLLPKESNNHRAKVLHHKSLVVLIGVLILGNIFIGFMEQNFSAVLGITASFNQDDLLLQTNTKRAENGLPPLQLNPALSQAALEKGKDMLARNYWAHNAPDGTTPWVFIKNSGYEYVYAGENLARGFASASDVTNAWMASQGHKDNLLSGNYDDVGFAVLTGTLTGDETILVVQEFGRKMAGGPDPAQRIASNVTPVPTTVQTVRKAIAPTVILTATPTPLPIVAQVSAPPPIPSVAVKQSGPMVASVQNLPLVDSKSFSKNFTILIVLFFISVLILDIIVIERKKIVRLLSHNADHLLFLLVILLILLTLGRGVIL